MLTNPGLRGENYSLTGPESVTFAEQIDILSKAIGRPVAVNPVTRDEWKKEMGEYIPESFADGLLDWWRSTDNAPVRTTDTVEKLTGHPARGFAVWAEDHAAEFQS